MRSLIWTLLLLPILALIIFWSRHQGRPHQRWDFDCGDDDAQCATAIENNGNVERIESNGRNGRVRTMNRSDSKRPARMSSDSSCESNLCFTAIGLPRASEEKAYEDALEQAALRIRDEYSLRSTLPLGLVKRMAKVDSKEPITVEIGGGKKTECQRVTLTVEVAPEDLREIGRYEKEHRVQRRMLDLARVLAVFVVGLGAVAAYVRLDDWSKGYYTGVLKALAVVAVIGAGVGVWQL